jgi:uncharacterized protein (TIGR02265 family)
VVKLATHAYLVKGATFRAYVKYLKTEGKLDAVLEKISPAAASALREPPLQGSWIDAHLLVEVVEAIDALEGSEGVLKMGREVIRREMLPFFFPMIQTVMRVMGTSPATLLARFPQLVQTSVQGVEFHYRVTSPTSGTMEAYYATDRPLKRCAFLQSVPPIEQILRVCGVQGTVSEPDVRSPKLVHYHIRW